MMYKKREAIISFLTFFILFVLLVFYRSNHQPLIYTNQKLDNEPGIFNLSKIDFDIHTLIGLEGESEFYWKQLLEPKDFLNPDIHKGIKYTEIPNTWNNIPKDNYKFKGFGYATYRFKILLPKDDIYALKIKEFESAYCIWIDGEKLINTGSVGKSEEGMTPSWRRKIAYFQSKDKVVDIVIQISNFHHRKGGPENLMILGKAENIVKLKSSALGIELFLLGILFILSVYHLVLYFYRRKDKTFLFFSILCILLSLRILTTGEEILSDIFPNISWYTSIKIEYLSYKLAMPILLVYAYQFYKTEVSLKVVQVFSIISLIFSIFTLFAPSEIFTFTPIVYQIIVVISAVYLLYILIKASLKRIENSLIFLSSYALFFLIIINDILYFNNIVSSGYLMPFGAFILAYVQSVLLSKNVSLTFIRMESLSNRLDIYSKQLEKKVEERTYRIQQQKDEIEQQAISLKEANTQLLELISFKESLTEMIIHDLKNPLNIVLNFSKDESVIFAGNQMLNLVQNMLDVQRYENSVMQLNQSEVEVSELIKQAVFQLNFLVNEKNINLTIQQRQKYYVYVDEDILNRVIVNLLSNALKFTPIKGTVKIYIEEEKNFLNICIADSGPGIPQNQKEVIFKKFGQFISQKLGRLGSTGLGLTFCKMAIEAHKGTIDYTSELGKGTIFCCSLPFNNKQQNDKVGSTITTYAKQEIDTIELSKKEKELIAVIIDDLSKVELYEISKIKTLISKIDKNQSENVKKWISELQKSIWNSDYNSFSKLIAKVK